MVRVHFGPPLQKREEKDNAGSEEGEEFKGWTRKPALGNSPVDCCNRRGFSAEKRVHFGPPLLKRTSNGGLAQLGERLPCKQEVTGSIPVLSTIQEID